MTDRTETLGVAGQGEYARPLRSTCKPKRQPWDRSVAALTWLVIDGALALIALILFLTSPSWGVWR